MKLSVLLVLLVALGSSVASASTRDTLAYFDPNTASAFYRDHGITAQAARFDLPAPAYVRRLTLWLAGRTTGTATVRLYGDEGAFAAPLLGEALGGSITVRKDRPGVQKVEVLLAADLFVERPQFFVVVSDLSEGMVWLSDRREKRARCASGSDRWLYQGIRGSDGVWRAGKYGYAVEAIVDYPQEVPPTYLSDITADAIPSSGGVSAAGGRGGPPLLGGVPREAGRGGSHVSDAGSVATGEHAGSIAWADVDNDTRLDLLVGGRLYINKGDDRFEDGTDRLDEAPGTSVHHFLDIDNDGDPDILLLGLADGTARLLENDGDGYFRSRRLDLPAMSEPTTVSITDVDGDGFLDAFIGQGRDDSGAVQPGYLLLNTRANGFVASIPTQGDRSDEADPEAILASQWIDYDSDGDPDLFLTAHSSTGNRLLLNDGSGRVTPQQFNASGPSGAEPMTSASLGDGLRGAGDWADYDADGDPDLLQPVRLDADQLAAGSSTATPIHRQESELLSSAVPALPYQGFSGGGVWADVDNDGLLDALVTSSCDCRFAALYVQDASGAFHDESFEYGLFRLPAGADAVWADYNNDGKLDLSTFVGGRFTLLKNTGDFPANWIAADLIPSFGGVSAAGGRGGFHAAPQSIGGTVTIHYGEKTQSRPIVSGRGMLMQGPLRVHFGLGDVGAVDSLVVEWNGERRTLVSPALNRIHSPFREEGVTSAQATEIAFTAWPNPFRTALNFRYTVPEKSHVRLEVHRLDGELLAVLVDGEQEGGEQSREWRAVDRSGTPLSAGTYIYRIRIGSHTLTGRAVLTK